MRITAMPERKFKSLHRKMTPEEKASYQRAKAEVEAEKPELTRRALVRKQELLELADAMRTLKREREARGISLTELAQRSGIDKANLSRLENDPYPNPTLDTLSRIAHAIGVRLTIGIVAA